MREIFCLNYYVCLVETYVNFSWLVVHVQLTAHPKDCMTQFIYADHQRTCCTRLFSDSSKREL